MLNENIQATRKSKGLSHHSYSAYCATLYLYEDALNICTKANISICWYTACNEDNS